ncbi:MAG: SAM hydrolase/SAM-dependent halogenase family protein [Candidatus Zhuqueibacterota bacterium]
MKPNGIITLLTDFGDADGFVGIMKGVILSINDQARVIDISNSLPSQDIEAGALILENSHRYFPKGTIHVAVVDPGVGSDRRILGVQTQDYFFIAPDNTLLKFIFYRNETLSVVELLNKQYFLPEISRTFHGRDIFAPVAAHLSLGVPLTDFGPQVVDFQRGEIFQPVILSKKIIGNIVHIDKFGNLITDIHGTRLNKPILVISAGSTAIHRLVDSYAHVTVGAPLAIIGSSGFLEISVRNGNASEQCALHRGDIVQVEFR